MRRTLALIAGLCLLISLTFGCDDRVRQAFVPYLTSSLQSLSTGLIEALESEIYPESSSSSSSSDSSSSSSSSG